MKQKWLPLDEEYERRNHPGGYFDTINSIFKDVYENLVKDYINTGIQWEKWLTKGAKDAKVKEKK